jgi:hypothetical protein
MLQNFVHVVNVLHLRMDRTFGTDLAAKAAGDAERFRDSHFHSQVFFKKSRPARGSAPTPRA